MKNQKQLYIITPNNIWNNETKENIFNQIRNKLELYDECRFYNYFVSDIIRIQVNQLLGYMVDDYMKMIM